jgi:alanine dehydrogenase
VLVDRAALRRMRPGSVVVDVAVDQGGCLETTRPTTHSNPVYVEEGVVHYCVSNMPGAVPATSTQALCNATLPYALLLATLGVEQAIAQRQDIALGVNTRHGEVVNPAVAQALAA